MKNEADVKEWVRFADMDVLYANHLNEIQYPKPLTDPPPMARAGTNGYDVHFHSYLEKLMFFEVP
ncbi:MAG: hypothetical protein IJL80_12195 [Treponema sp.]|nr:hypothetical protein [Treponema sp.]